MNPAIIYTRLSSSNQSFNNGIYVSIENQINKCNEYCQNLNMSVTQTVTEIKSAKNINKQIELQKILNENSNINIIFYNITRFSRNTGQAIDFVNKCVEKGIKLHFAEENFTIDHFMDLHRLRLGLSQAEYESNVISNRVRSNNNVLRNKGWKFGRPRYGKMVLFKNGIRKFTANRHEQEIISFIVMARIGQVSCSTLNRQLKKIVPKNNNYIFHAGTKLKNSKIYSNGGRVLNFVIKSKNLKQSRDELINLINDLNWENGYFRKDIGFKIFE